MKKFTIKESLKFGWQKTIKHFWFFVGVLLVVLLATSIIPDLVAEQLGERYLGLTVLVLLAGWVLQIIANIGLINIALKIHDDQKPIFGDLVAKTNLFFKYVFASALYGLIVLGGFLLLIVPGIIWTIKFQFYGYFIVEKGLGPIQAIKESGKATMGSKWDLFWLLILLVLINILGAITFIGLLLTVPLTLMAMVYVYKKLVPPQIQ